MHNKITQNETPDTTLQQLKQYSQNSRPLKWMRYLKCQHFWFVLRKCQVWTLIRIPITWCL